MSTLARLDRVNWWLRVLDAYARRVSMAFWMPRTRDRVLYRIGKKFRRYQDERRRIEALIAADPQLKAQQRARAVARAQPHLAQLASTDLPQQALQLTSLLHTERRLKTAYQEALWYYKDGGWKHDGIAVERVTALLDAFKADLHAAAQSRLTHQHIFERSVAATTGDTPRHIAVREQLMREAEKGAPPPQTQNPFHAWIADNVPNRSQAKTADKAHDQIAALAKGR